MKHLLREAQGEINRLRRQNEILTAKVEVMDLFACVLHTHPATYNPPMSVDVAWSLQKAHDEIVEQERRDAMTSPEPQPE